MSILYVVATPIGNLEDITFRAVETLKKVEYIACEDTRETKKLLTHLGISGKKLIPYHEHNEQKSAQKIIELLEETDVALVSDAGTPCISDPGYRVVKLAVQNNIRVVPIPGAFAGAVALSASGLPSDKFLFVGFLDKKESKKRKELEKYKNIGYTFIVYESPKRVMKTLELYAEVLPESDTVVAKELTKIHERFIYGKPKEIIEFFKENPDILKGEFVILCHPEEKKEVSQKEIEEKIIELKQKGLTKKEITKEISKDFDIPKNKAYKLVLELLD